MLKITLIGIFALFSYCSVEASRPYFLEGCPYIELHGKVEHSVLPGAPNYESIREGDVASERWFLIPSESSVKYLCQSGVFETIPDDYRPVINDWKDHVHSIQLAASGELQTIFEKRNEQEITLEGWLGSWPVHCYSIFFFEVAKIKN